MYLYIYMGVIIVGKIYGMWIWYTYGTYIYMSLLWESGAVGWWIYRWIYRGYICIFIYYCGGKVGQNIQGIYRINASLYIIVGGKWGRRLTECRGI